MDTIFALSSGAPPAAIAVVRVSGPRAGKALERMCGRLPEPRRAVLTSLRDGEGVLLDQALVLWFPGPRSETGEDCAELQLHGGRAVVDAVCSELARFEGLRLAEPGEFTRRAFTNGRMDLLQVEGLADLVMAETEMQRRAALGLAGGALSRQVDGWLERLLALSSNVESALDFSDEGDVAGLSGEFHNELNDLAAEFDSALSAPHAEALREGFRVVLAGPPNCGKSTLFNALVNEEAAIVSPVAGTTRDVIVRNVALRGVPFSMVDTAGLRDGSRDSIEVIGIGRAHSELGKADLVLWLGREGEGPSGKCWEIDAKIDETAHRGKRAPRHRVSALTVQGISELAEALVNEAREALPAPGQFALDRRQRTILAEARDALLAALNEHDHLLIAESLRRARVAFDRLTGRAATEDMLNTLFSRFCIGK